MTLDIQADPPAAEVQIHSCGYDAACRVRSCRQPAAFIARYIDGRGYFLRQFELVLDTLIASKPATKPAA
jgi:hypothetical protein